MVDDDDDDNNAIATLGTAMKMKKIINISEDEVNNNGLIEDLQSILTPPKEINMDQFQYHVILKSQVTKKH